MMLRLLCWSIFLVFLCAITPVMAQSPDDGIMRYIQQYPLVHDKTCNIHPLRLMNVSCNVWYDEERDIRWYALYDTEDKITHLFAVKDTKMQMFWQRHATL